MRQPRNMTEEEWEQTNELLPLFAGKTVERVYVHGTTGVTLVLADDTLIDIEIIDGKLECYDPDSLED